jgi:hypothetical protein
MSDPPQPSITVKVFELDTWDHQWEEYHEHADPEDEGCVYGPLDDDGSGELLECCGEQRPEAPQSLVVDASAKEYVTVHDYVSAAHEWLLEHFSDISSAVNIWDDGEALAGQKLVVIHANLQSLSIMDENIQQHVGQFGPAPDPDETRGLSEQLGRGGSDRHDESIQEQMGQWQPTPPRGSWPSLLPGPRIHWMTPDQIRKLNEQLRREGSDVLYDENATRNLS